MSTVDHEKKQKVPSAYSRADDGAHSLHGHQDDEVEKKSVSRMSPSYHRRAPDAAVRWQVDGG
ncbi:MAG TPA: hypothetical protein VGK01_03440 [Candidatus Angelobacter sp.]|jgi:hypothetical protein